MKNKITLRYNHCRLKILFSEVQLGFHLWSESGTRNSGEAVSLHRT